MNMNEDKTVVLNKEHIKIKLYFYDKASGNEKPIICTSKRITPRLYKKIAGLIVTYEQGAKGQAAQVHEDVLALMLLNPVESFSFDNSKLEDDTHELTGVQVTNLKKKLVKKLNYPGQILSNDLEYKYNIGTILAKHYNIGITTPEAFREALEMVDGQSTPVIAYEMLMQTIDTKMIQKEYRDQFGSKEVYEEDSEKVSFEDMQSIQSVLQYFHFFRSISAKSPGT
ncbi:MAG: hypothetical protein GY853_14610 [PVC group bacterium]|nr:hypothetical protein [PVC group bacterium]